MNDTQVFFNTQLMLLFEALVKPVLVRILFLHLALISYK